MKRRKFIALTTLSVASLGIPFVSCNSHDIDLDKKLSVPEILAQITDKASIIAIGKAYGKANADEYSLSALERDLKKDKDGKSISAATPEKEIMEFLRKKIENDFASENISVCDGWVLSSTEAKQCAMFALVNDN